MVHEIIYFSKNARVNFEKLKVSQSFVRLVLYHVKMMFV